MSECIFCAISEGSAPATKLFEDDRLIAFEDIHPVAKVHLVVVPKQHIKALDQLSAKDHDLLGHLLNTAKELGSEHSPEHGYRIAINGGGQEDVDHLHLHVMGGQADLGEPAKGVIDK